MNQDFPFAKEPWFEGFENKTLNQYVSELRSTYSDKEIADGFGLSLDQLCMERSKVFNEQRLKKYEQIAELIDAGKRVSEISRETGIPESTIRYMLNTHSERRASTAKRVAQLLMEIVDEKKMIDVGEGAELSSIFYGVSWNTFKVAISICEDHGYHKYTLAVRQLCSEQGNVTKMKVLCSPEITRKEAKKNIADVKLIDDNERDMDVTDAGIPPVKCISASRIFIAYAEDGGADYDGSIYIRPGLKDLNLGTARYAQVRIGVDADGYLGYMKGVVTLSNHIPKGYDVIYWTNKHRGAPISKVFKPFEVIKNTCEIDWSNPFGTSIKPEWKLRLIPRYYYDDNGEKQVSPINVIYEPGDWAAWTRTVPPQFLSKQSIYTVKKQLMLTLAEAKVEFESLMKLTNPAVRAKMLFDFGEKCDLDAVELKATPYPGQQYYVLTPFKELKPTQIYAPNYPNGTKCCIIRYPHAGKFELPILIVNNNVPICKEVLGNTPPDAVGINPDVAKILSGADFDGDFVSLIPIDSSIAISNVPPLAGLKGYEPKDIYHEVKGMKYLSKKGTQTEMGLITNLIADMQIKGAPLELVEYAVKHSMCVIDAHKHKLNYMQSYKDNHIAFLKTQYQGGPKAGASTLITRSGARKDITYKKRAAHDDPKTGKKIFIEKKRTFIGRSGKKIEIKKKTTQMYDTENAFELCSNGGENGNGYPVEIIYAEFANELKALANLARKEAMACPKLKATPQAKAKFAPQLASLKAKVRVARANSPRERAAHRYAGEKLRQKYKEHNEWLETLPSEERALYEWDEEDKNKMEQQYLSTARVRFDAHTLPIIPDHDEWLAINSGAVSQTLFDDIQRYADKEALRELATPHEEQEISRSMIEYILRLNEQGFPTYEISSRTRLSTDRIAKVIMEENF